MKKTKKFDYHITINTNLDEYSQPCAILKYHKKIPLYVAQFGWVDMMKGSMGRIYIKFAIENAEMYDLMFNLKAPMEFLDAVNEEEWNEGKATFDVLNTTVKQCIDEGHFKGHNLEPLSFMIWSLVHGMCCLEIRQRSKGVNLTNPETIVIDAYNEFLKMIYKL
jgi:hypothetical protein